MVSDNLPRALPGDGNKILIGALAGHFSFNFNRLRLINDDSAPSGLGSTGDAIRITEN